MSKLSRFAKSAAAFMAFSSLATPHAASAGSVAATARYVVQLGGMNVATANVNFADSGSKFAIDLDANVSGVGAIVAAGSAAAVSEGRSTGKGLAANDFELMTQTRKDQFSVKVQYASGNAEGFQIQPPLINNIGRVAIERKDLRGVTDPLGSFILKAKSLSPDLCERRLKVFTGIERYDIKMSFGEMTNATSARTGYQGPVVLCRLRYIPVSGHFETSEMTKYLAKSDRIMIWYAPLGESGYFIPYRVLMGTGAGDLSMVLTALE